MALDEATTAFLALMGKVGAPPIHEMTPREARALGSSLAELYGEGPEMHHVADLTAPAKDGHVIPLRLLRPVARPRGIIVYYHGGGWTMGSLPEFEALGRVLAHRTDCAVVLVDYRLAPEYRYPTAADDAWDALTWVHAHLDDLVGRQVPVIVAGDSAGANLAAVVARRARDAGEPKIAMQVLACPVADCDLDNRTYLDPANQLILSRDTMAWFWNHYAPDEAVRKDPDISPARASSMAGLPTAVVLIAEHDVLRQEGEEYVDQLRAAGVTVDSKVFEGQMHDFFVFVNVLPGSAEGVSYVAAAIDRHLGT